MTSFTTRVALHEADSDDYELLYEEMESEGFEKTITSKDKNTYDLPDGEYNLTGDFSTEEVLKKAKSAAKKTRIKYSVLVTKSNECKWYGLEKT
jgi:hypothetical protein